MDASDRAAVLARARQGDSDAFRALVERHSHRVFRLAFRMTGNEQDAEDVVQESFLRAYRHLGRFEARADFGTWLYRIVANCSVETIRSRRARHDPLRTDVGGAGDALEKMTSDSPGPERLAASAEVRRQIEAALGALSELERAAFTLRHYEGWTIEEIGRALGLGASATKHSIFRAVRKLRATLGPLRSPAAPGR